MYLHISYFWDSCLISSHLSYLIFGQSYQFFCVRYLSHLSHVSILRYDRLQNFQLLFTANKLDIYGSPIFEWSPGQRMLHLHNVTTSRSTLHSLPKPLTSLSLLHSTNATIGTLWINNFSYSHSLQNNMLSALEFKGYQVKIFSMLCSMKMPA